MSFRSSHLRLLICYTHVTRRHEPQLSELNKRLPGLLAVSFGTSEQVYPWWKGYEPSAHFEHRTLCNRPLEQLVFSEIKTSLSTLLDQYRPTAAIIAGYFHPAQRYLARVLRKRGVPRIMTCVSWVRDRRRLFAKELVKRLWIPRLFSAACAAGTRSEAYCLHLGFPASRVWKAFNNVDNAFYARVADEAREQAGTVRRLLGVPQNYFLYVGLLATWKNIRGLLYSFIQYRQAGGSWGLVLVGDGPERAYVESVASALPAGAVKLAGLHDATGVAQHYGLASCLVLPSLREPWGLVVNEAMAAGLPVLVSESCGCVPELVHRGINGYTFDPTRPSELASLFHHVERNPQLCAEMGRASREIVSYYTPARWAAAVADCVRTLVTERGPLA